MRTETIVVALLVSAPLIAAGGEGKVGNESDYIRFADEGRWEGRVETSVATFTGRDGIEVSLVAAVHVGDRSYYQGLQRLLEGYQAVLCEGLEPAKKEAQESDERVAEGSSADVQRGSQATIEDWAGRILLKLQWRVERLISEKVFGLERQWEQMDYTKKNFVAAEMDQELFWRLVRERGEIQAELRRMMRSLPIYAQDLLARLVSGPECLRDAPELFSGLCGPEWNRLLRYLVTREAFQAAEIMGSQERPVELLFDHPSGRQCRLQFRLGQFSGPLHVRVTAD